MAMHGVGALTGAPGRASGRFTEAARVVYGNNKSIVTSNEALCINMLRHIDPLFTQFGRASMESDIGRPVDKMSHYHEIMMRQFDGDSTCDLLETGAASSLQQHPTTEKSDEADHSSASMLDAVKRIEELEDVVLCQARVMDQMSKHITLLLERTMMFE